MDIIKGRASGLPAGARVAITISWLVGTGFAGAASANTIHVCSTCAHTSIQAAANDAVSGDTISIAAGRYFENVRTAGKSLTFLGQSAGSTLVYASGTGPVFTLGSAVAGDPNVLITIRGLTISHGNHYTGTGVGGGVQVRAGAYLHIQDSTLTENTAFYGSGIGIDSPGAPETTVTNCHIDRNFGRPGRPPSVGGGVAVQAGSRVTITNSIITNNTASGSGGGIDVDGGGTLHIIGTTISGNRVDGFEGPFGLNGGAGGGVAAFGALTVESSYIVNNSTNGEGGGGGGLFLRPDSNSTVTLSNTLVAQNLSQDGAGGIDTGVLFLELNNSYVIQNAAVGIGGNAVLKMKGSTVKDNVGYNFCINNVCTQ